MQDGTAQLRIRRLSNFAKNNGLPVGFEYFTINKNIRTGSLPLLGGLYSRELYADLWSWVQEQPGYLISETEWQAKSQANNGNVPFYSSGDGSTTFRVPSLKCWVKSGSEITEVGSYLTPGLPNLAECNDVGGYSIKSVSPSPLFPNTSLVDNTMISTVTDNKFELAAAKPNPIYGNSNEVTPRSIVGLYCVIAFSTISNIGNLDVQTLYNKVIELENKLAPVGTILTLSDDEVPEGYLPAEGAEISRTTYADLFNVIGTKFGEGDGSTTFSLPNLVGRFLESDGVPGTLKEPGLPNITSQFRMANASAAFGCYFPEGAFYATGNSQLGSPAAAVSYQLSDTAFSASLSNPIYDKSSVVQPASVTVKFCIKY